MGCSSLRSYNVSCLVDLTMYYSSYLLPNCALGTKIIPGDIPQTGLCKDERLYW